MSIVLLGIVRGLTLGQPADDTSRLIKLSQADTRITHWCSIMPAGGTAHHLVPCSTEHGKRGLNPRYDHGEVCGKLHIYQYRVS